MKGRALRIDEPIAIIINDQSTHGIEGDFLFSQLMLGVLLQTPQSMEARNELISYCKNKCVINKRKELQILKEYRKRYSPYEALRWYTRESNLYRLLNQALRLQDIEAIYVFRFFIRDLYAQLWNYRCSRPVLVYRGQKISRNELETFEKSIGQLVSFKSFISTSFDRQIAVDFALTGDGSLCSIMFEIEADPSRTSTKPFADISNLSYYQTEAEVLFMCGSIFRLINVRYEDKLGIVRLQLCSDDDHELKKLFEYMRNRNNSGDSILAFGNLLFQMGKFDLANKYYRIGLNHLSSKHINAVYYYHGLGLVAKEKEDHILSLELLHKSLELYKAMGNHSAVASIYNSIGTLHVNKHDYGQALNAYNMALFIYNNRNHENREDLGNCYNNIGVVYHKQKKYLEALDYYRKALEIFERIFPEDHPQLGGSYHNIGDVHFSLGHHVYALEYYNLGLTIKEKSLPAKHINIATTYQSIGFAHECSGDSKQALLNYQKAGAIYQECLPADHPTLLKVKQQILNANEDSSQKKFA